MKLFFLCLLFIASISYGQVGTGQWRLHIPNRNCIDVVESNNIIFAAYENGILEYDIAASETSVWDNVNSLSDIKIACLSKSTYDNSIFIGYINGNIDKIKDNNVTNIPAIKLAQLTGSKKINKIVEYKQFMYVATDFGIVKIDPLKNEVKDSYFPTMDNSPILDVCFKNDSIFALTSSKLLKASAANIALADFSQWILESKLPVLTQNSYNEIESINNEIYVLFQHDDIGKDSIFKIKQSSVELVINSANNLEIYSINNINGRINVNFNGGFYIFNSDNTIFKDCFQYTFNSEVNINMAIESNNFIWLADSKNGLVKFSDNWNNEKIYLEGPPKDQFYSMDSYGGNVVIAGGGLSDKTEQFSGSGIYTFIDEKWDLKDRGNMTLWNQKYIWDFVGVAINPTNQKEIAVATYSRYPLSILAEGNQVTDTFNNYNSIIQKTSLNNGSSYLSDIQYDSKGNLWMFNGYSSNPLIVYTKEKTWTSFNLGSSAINKFTKDIAIDENDNKWLTIDGVGIIAYNDNATISDKSDDKLKIINDGGTSGALPSTSVNAIAFDLTNNLWIGTDNGFAILYNTSNVFDAAVGDYNAQRIKLEFEGNVEYLLGNTNITDIEIDGANRKWLATANTGIFLLSSDGLEIIQHFTEDNSPLISDNIIDLEMNQKTGEIFIITDKGLVSYRSDASEGADDYSQVTVFPNPARPDFNGLITIQGIKADSDIKITDVSGNLVFKTTSNGGTATWNGKTVEGERVKSGVYLIWTAVNEGKGRKVGKVVVIN
jgi:hypothetical protein